MPHKLCRELIYQLHTDGWVIFHEVSNRTDFNPAGTTYLIGMDVGKLARRLADEHYQTMCNMRMRQLAITERYRAHVPIGTDVVLSPDDLQMWNLFDSKIARIGKNVRIFEF